MLIIVRILNWKNSNTLVLERKYLCLLSKRVKDLICIVTVHVLYILRSNSIPYPNTQVYNCISLLSAILYFPKWFTWYFPEEEEAQEAPSATEQTSNNKSNKRDLRDRSRLVKASYVSPPIYSPTPSQTLNRCPKCRLSTTLSKSQLGCVGTSSTSSFNTSSKPPLLSVCNCSRSRISKVWLLPLSICSHNNNHSCCRLSMVFSSKCT